MLVPINVRLYYIDARKQNKFRFSARETLEIEIAFKGSSSYKF